jgi:hypothetical protein
MNISKNIYLVLAIILLLSFINSLFDLSRTHTLLLWEVDIWVYRLFRLGIAVYFMKVYLDKRNADKEEKK